MGFLTIFSMFTKRSNNSPREIVNFHNTSDSYINMQMEKSGWRDRAAYQSVPEAAALRQIAVPGVEGTRPFNSGLTQPSAFTSSYSKELYKAGAEFKVPTYDPSAKDGLKYSSTAMEKPAQAKGWVSDINQRLQQKQISTEDAAPVQAAYEAYKKDRTDENFSNLTARKFIATEAIPALEHALESGKLTDEDQIIVKKAQNDYRNNPSIENLKNIMRAQSDLQEKIAKRRSETTQ